MSFRQRLGAFLTIALVLIQSLTAFSAYLYLRQDLLARARLELTGAMGVFARQLDFVSEHVAASVGLLSLDFALRTAIANRDLGTQLSALQNHGERIGATRMMIAGLDGRVTADTAQLKTGERFRYPALLKDAAANGEGAGLVSANGKIFWVVTVPVRAPIPIAYVVAFIPIQDGLLRKMQAISSSHQSIALLARGSDGKWRVAAGTAGHGNAISDIGVFSGKASSDLVREDGGRFLRYVAPLDASPGSAPVVAVLEYPLEEALAAYRGIVFPMLVVLTLGLLAMLIGAALIARSLSRPLESLAVVSRRIAVGDYTPPPDTGRKDEIGDLAEALTSMAMSVSEREEGLRQAINAAEEAKEEAVRANRAKSDFLSNMSHELRTPLNAILGFSELIAVEALGPVGRPEYAGYARDVHRAGGHLLRQVDRMLTLANDGADRLELKNETFPAGKPVLATFDALQPLALQGRVRLQSDFPAQWPMLVGDAGKLTEALSNILHNAIRFTPQDGTVDLRASVDSGHLKIAIRDTGVGIDPATLGEVIRPFHRQRSAFDGTNQGAGIGLPYAKAIIDRHGGMLSIESQPGAGTTVTISLPVTTSRVEAA
ncbi:MAG TPA: ATP-binding protein [Rhizomicrobium sp.]|nr:ATP-binding protein [Rhizomicrobium sp.]